MYVYTYFIYLPDKSRYFATTEINNCFIIGSLFFWSTEDIESLSESSGTGLSFSHRSVVSITHEQNIFCGKTLICCQLFEGHVGVLSVNEK